MLKCAVEVTVGCRLVFYEVWWPLGCCVYVWFMVQPCKVNGTVKSFMLLIDALYILCVAGVVVCPDVSWNSFGMQQTNLATCVMWIQYYHKAIFKVGGAWHEKQGCWWIVQIWRIALMRCTIYNILKGWLKNVFVVAMCAGFTANFLYLSDVYFLHYTKINATEILFCNIGAHWPHMDVLYRTVKYDIVQTKFYDVKLTTQD